ncbi:MAG: SAM-dependent chlorinase/fluorinase [Prevotellaceae bacterium]|jgi:S-adenosylmethionine hydrolase|nr:SAM-dependent chlorinase/fluorinase [Prevotellaceae bacterium]
MAVVTLTTDWGMSDFYLASLKGALLQHAPQATLVDISHGIAQHDEAEAAFTLRHAYAHFPKGSIHIIGVNSAPNSSALLLAEVDGHYFICADNSCLSLMFVQPECVVSAAQEEKNAMLNAAPRLVQQLLSGVAVKDLGAPTELQAATPIAPVLNHKPCATGEQVVASMVGRILHIDSYGNAITNISQQLYNEHSGGRACTVFFNSSRYKSPQIFGSYTDVEMGSPVAFFNSLGLLEVATNHGNASHLYRLDKENSTITILFNGQRTTDNE